MLDLESCLRHTAPLGLTSLIHSIISDWSELPVMGGPEDWVHSSGLKGYKMCKF